MNRYRGFLRGALRFTLTLLVCPSCAGSVRADNTAPEPVEALIYSTMPSTAAHRPEMALDSDPGTYFRSVYGMGDGDDFLVLFSRAIPVQSLRLVTGDTDNQDTLTDGFVETSPDMVHYTAAADFDSGGVATAALGRRPVRVLRIRLHKGKSIPVLVVREITITSPVKLAHIQLGPGRGFFDISQAPDLAEWARKAEQQMESFWPDTAALLYTDGFIPPNSVNIVYRTGPGVTDVAATGGGIMTVNSRWCRAHPEDTGLTVHETAHVIQATPYNPVWLVEGIADYIRWIKFEPEHYHPRINPRTATYHDSYRTTATFLAWCELHYDSRLVTKLNGDIRFRTYRQERFKQYCGKDVDTLWSEFIAAYQADPVGIVTPPVVAADRPRKLPDVKAGSSVQVDLTAVFNTQGVTRDATAFHDGFDGGGAAYSADLLGVMPTWQQVQFRLGAAVSPNTVTCNGEVVALPSGAYGSLWLLGAAVEGAQMEQVFTLTCADGTTEQLIQNLSDWFEPQRFSGESRAVKMAYRNMADGTKDQRTFYLYSYGFSLKAEKMVKSLTLPNNVNVKILAITLAN